MKNIKFLNRLIKGTIKLIYEYDQLIGTIYLEFKYFFMPGYFKIYFFYKMCILNWHLCISVLFAFYNFFNINYDIKNYVIQG